MAEIIWTEAQKNAIEAGGTNILVSAAAGSGKTAVLVERIIERISDTDAPADISSFVVITFTRAAAQQMRSKIYAGLKKKLDEDPENSHLKAQLIRLAGARICTIDSLCADIVRENFQETDGDTALRIADEAELKLLKSDVVKEVLENHFKEPTQGFTDFISAYTDKSDAKAEEIILSLYDFSQSHPEPEAWIRRCAEAYVPGEDGEPAAWMEYFRNYTDAVAAALSERIDEGLSLCAAPGGPEGYARQFESYRAFLRDFTAPDTPFDQKEFLLRSFLADPGKLSCARKGVDLQLKEHAKYLNGSIKAELKELKEKFFTNNYGILLGDMEKCAPVAEEICSLVLEFSQRFAQAKAERRISDFNDMEHRALQVLIKRGEDGSFIKNENGYAASAAADRMAKGITEIIVDEYQDTNELQDALLFALSSERFGRPNVFMVGDVKQSIYGFRMACPALFSEKYNSYAGSDPAGRRIILSENFRSRRQIIDITNAVFERTMIPEAGGIDYLDGAQMAFGAKALYPEEGDEGEFTPEIIFVNEAGEAGKMAEGRQIARRIRELVTSGRVTDKESGQLRQVRWDDIVILVRNSNNPELLKCLKAADIPVISASGKGFFDSFEIRLTIDLLGIIDNPFQDIPLAAVLTSPVAGLSSADLARIKISTGGADMFLFDACRQYLQEEITPDVGMQDKASAPGMCTQGETLVPGAGTRGETLVPGMCTQGEIPVPGAGMRGETLVPGMCAQGKIPVPDSCAREEIPASDAAKGRLRTKLAVFMEKLEDYRRRAVYMGVCELFDYVLKDSGLYNIFSAMPGGSGRQANIDYLRSRVRDFAGTSYSGLFDLIRYVEQVKKSEINFGGGSDISGVSAVRVMTIHKSKGLEFPVVFIAGAGRSYNTNDLRQSIIPDRELGFGMELRDPGARTLRTTLLMQIIKLKKKLDTCAEEMRLLYVAMTRAKEKLIVTASGKISRETPSRWIFEGSSKKPFFCGVRELSSYRDVLACALSVRRGAQNLYELTEFDSGDYIRPEPAGLFDLKITYALQTQEEEAAQGVRSAQLQNRTRALLAGSFASEAAPEYVYPHAAATVTPVKITASALEEHAPAADGEVHSFVRKKTGLTAGERGTAYHSFFEHLDYAFFRENSAAEAVQMINDFKNAGYLSAAEAAVLEPEKIAAFLCSPLGKRMKTAEENGKLVREQQFIMAFEDAGEMRILQGIIDAFFEEDGEIVLVDYKSDRGKDDADFINTYRPQQDAYKNAIEAALGKRVKQQVIFALEGGREIYL